MMNELLLQTEQDCMVMLDRIFHGRSLTIFGEDGGGQHGRSTFPLTCPILAYSIDIEQFSDDFAEIQATVALRLDGYNADDTGHAITDHNLRISLNTLLDAETVDRDALDWAPLERQGRDLIVLSCRVDKLLAW